MAEEKIDRLIHVLGTSNSARCIHSAGANNFL